MISGLKVIINNWHHPQTFSAYKWNLCIRLIFSFSHIQYTTSPMIFHFVFYGFICNYERMLFILWNSICVFFIDLRLKFVKLQHPRQITFEFQVPNHFYLLSQMASNKVTAKCAFIVQNCVPLLILITIVKILKLTD